MTYFMKMHDIISGLTFCVMFPVNIKLRQEQFSDILSLVECVKIDNNS